MAVLDDEIMIDAQIDAEIITHVRQQLPQELKEQMDDDLLFYFHDLIEDYFAESDALEAEADEEGYVNVDLEVLARHLQQKAKKEGMGDFSADDLLLLAEADLSYFDDFEVEE